MLPCTRAAKFHCQKKRKGISTRATAYDKRPNLCDKDQKRTLNKKGIDLLKQKIEHVAHPELNNLE